MSNSVRSHAAPAEEDRFPTRDESRPRLGNNFPDHLRMAKAKFGSYVRAAIGEEPAKVFGPPNRVAELCAGDRGVNDVLAQIADDKLAKRRMALAMLESDDGVVIRYEVTVQKKAG